MILSARDVDLVGFWILRLNRGRLVLRLDGHVQIIVGNYEQQRFCPGIDRIPGAIEVILRLCAKFFGSCHGIPLPEFFTGRFDVRQTDPTFGTLACLNS
jgi:hypothetical protein